MEFTLRQKRKINQYEGKMKQLWIDHFTHINEIKQSDVYKKFKEEEMIKKFKNKT